MEEKQLKKFEENAIDLMTEAEMIVIKNEEHLELAAKIGIDATNHIKEIDLFFEDSVKKAKEAVAIARESQSSLKTTIQKIKDPFERIKLLIQEKSKKFLIAEREKERKAKEKAEKKAKRKEQREIEKLNKRVENLRAKGKEEKAEEIENQIKDVFEIPDEVDEVDKSVKTEDGMMTERVTYEAIVIDPQRLCEAIGNGTFPLTYTYQKQRKMLVEFKKSGLDQIVNSFNLDWKECGIRKVKSTNIIFK